MGVGVGESVGAAVLLGVADTVGVGALIVGDAVGSNVGEGVGSAPLPLPPQPTRSANSAVASTCRERSNRLREIHEAVMQLPLTRAISWLVWE